MPARTLLGGIKMEAFDILIGNHLNHNKFSDVSLIGCVTGRSEWSADQFWLIAKSLYELDEKSKEDDRLFREAVREAIFIYSTLALSFSWHFDPGDHFEYQKLTTDQIYDWRDRTNMLFEGFIAGGMPDRIVFGDSNPLLQ